MWANPVPWPGRALAVLLLLLAGIAFGAVAGLRYESNKRDAQALQQKRADEQVLQFTLANGKHHAEAVIAWRNKARIYYRNWQERLSHENDTQLAQCKTQPGAQAQAGLSALQLGATWVSLYNAAWLPQLEQQDDTGGAAYSLVEAGAATPREVLDNVRINAELCGEDRKRLDELIDHLTETGSAK